MTHKLQKTIVFTDSGLGGLNIMADFHSQLINDFRLNQLGEIDLVFFNALPEKEAGYNTIESLSKKTKLFDSSLHIMEERFQPNILIIACNSLSALYPNTSFSKIANNTIEIISHGLSQIKNHRKANPNEPVFVLATSTTIQSKAYYIDDEMVHYISGENLASLIETNFKDPKIERLLVQVLKQIKIKSSINSSCALFIGCTHYAYIKNQILKLSLKFDLNIRVIINPGDALGLQIRNIFKGEKPADLETTISIKIESQALITSDEVKSIATLLQEKSPEISSALKRYTRLPKLF